MKTEYAYEPGIYCQAFGDNPKNRVIESFLFTHGGERSIKDTAEDTHLPRTITYDVMSTLLNEKIVLSTRKIGNGQLYTLNRSSKHVKFLLKVKNLLVNELVAEYTARPPQEALQH